MSATADRAKAAAAAAAKADAALATSVSKEAEAKERVAKMLPTGPPLKPAGDSIVNLVEASQETGTKAAAAVAMADAVVGQKGKAHAPRQLIDPTNPVVLATGSAYGNHYTTEQMLECLIAQRKKEGDTDFDEAFAGRVLKACGYDFHSVALPIEDVFRRMSREEYLEHRMTNLLRLAAEAGECAIQRWGGDRKDITHLFWGTMTGAMHSPTIDILLVKKLDLNRDVERTSIEGMGCLTGYRCLNLARSVVATDPNARILVIEGDLRSALGNSLPNPAGKQDVVAVSLFRDASSSAIVSNGAGLKPTETPLYEMVTGMSRIVDDTHELVNYVERDDGAINLHLSKYLPDAIGVAEPAFVGDLIKKGENKVKASPKYGASFKLPAPKEMDILCHTGGPRVLKEVAKAIDATEENLASSWAIMKAHGNLSGASNMAVLDHHNQRRLHGPPSDVEWCVCLSMGPGVCLEGLFIRSLHNGVATEGELAAAAAAAKGAGKDSNCSSTLTSW